MSSILQQHSKLHRIDMQVNFSWTYCSQTEKYAHGHQQLHLGKYLYILLIIYIKFLLVKMASKVLMTTLHPAHVTTFWDRSSASAATPFIKEFTYVKKTLIYLSVPNDFSQLRVPSVVCTTTREMIVKRPKRYILISPTVYD